MQENYFIMGFTPGMNQAYSLAEQAGAAGGGYFASSNDYMICRVLKSC